MPYLIDGHNVIAALPDIDLADNHDEAQLVIKLRTWTARIRRKAIVIFDGGVVGGPSSDLSSPDVHVVFAARFHTNADRIIRERLKSLRDAPNWTVISSDHEILDEARLVGAKVMTAQRFAELLNQPSVPDLEKPDYVSPAAVNAWLEHFPEPDSQKKSVVQHPVIVTPPQSKTPSKIENTSIPEKQKRRKVKREMRSIGEQLGHEISYDPNLDQNPESSDKPTDISSEEIDNWLQVFHDPVESYVPKPKIQRKHVKPERPKTPVIRKTGELTEEEVSTWLDIFPETESETDKNGSHSPKDTQNKYRQRKLNKKLAQHKAKHIGSEENEPSSLSDEDVELWQRMFGSKD